MMEKEMCGKGKEQLELMHITLSVKHGEDDAMT